MNLSPRLARRLAGLPLAASLLIGLGAQISRAAPACPGGTFKTTDHHCDCPAGSEKNYHDAFKLYADCKAPARESAKKEAWAQEQRGARRCLLGARAYGPGGRRVEAPPRSKSFDGAIWLVLRRRSGRPI